MALEEAKERKRRCDDNLEATKTRSFLRNADLEMGISLIRRSNRRKSGGEKNERLPAVS